MTRTAVLPALLLSLSLVVTGCGGDEKKATTSTNDATSQDATLTKAQFRARANKICAQGSRKLEAAAKKRLSNQPTAKDVTAFASDVLVPNVQRQHDRIAALRPPQGDEAEVKALLASLQRGIDSVDGDPTVFITSEPFRQANKLAGRYGLAKCAAD